MVVRPILDRVNQALIDHLAEEHAPPINTLTPAEGRSGLLRAQAGYRAPEAIVEDQVVKSGARELRLRSIRPRSLAEGGPVILYLHGGGWVLGDAATHDRLVREIAAGAEATIVFVEYSRAPEHPYPVAIEEGYAATCYVSEHPEEFGVDPRRLILAGDSAGGNLAIAVALLVTERRGPRIAGQLLFYPVTNADFGTGSYQQFSDGPWLTKAAMQWFWDQYIPDRALRKEPTASPLLASLEQLQGLPRTLILTAENDVLRDEGEAYGRRLIEAGVEVVTTRYNGTIHDFMMLNALASAAPTRAALAQATTFLRSVGCGKPAS